MAESQSGTAWPSGKTRKHVAEDRVTGQTHVTTNSTRLEGFDMHADPRPVTSSRQPPAALCRLRLAGLHRPCARPGVLGSGESRPLSRVQRGHP